MTGKFDRSQKEPAEGTRVHYSTVKNRSALQSHPDWKTFADNEQVNYQYHNNRNHVEKNHKARLFYMKNCFVTQAYKVAL